MSKKYKLTLTEAQAEVVSKACEFYARIGCGQYSEILWHFMDLKDDDASERRDEAERLLFKARAKIYPELGEVRGHSYGIGRNDEWYRSFDVYQVLRHALGDSRDLWTNLPEAFASCEVVEVREDEGRQESLWNTVNKT